MGPPDGPEHEHADVEEVLSTLGQGEFFGEISILSDRPRSATASVAMDATFLLSVRC